MTIRVQHESAEAQKQLVAKVEALQKTLAAEKRKYKDLEFKYACECTANLELCGILEAYDIPYRKYLSRKERERIE